MHSSFYYLQFILLLALVKSRQDLQNSIYQSPFLKIISRMSYSILVDNTFMTTLFKIS